MADTGDTMLHEDIFPGNKAAFRELLDCLAGKRVIVFTGAGTSVPAIPTWFAVLRRFLAAAVDGGVLAKAEADELDGQIEADPLEVASAVEEAFTAKRFRAMLAATFDAPDVCTATHELVMALPALAFVTLNYDPGLSNAFVKRFRAMPEIIKPQDTFQLTRWRQAEGAANRPGAIIHWHGVASAPNDIVFTADDYDRLYGDAQTVAFLQELWRNHQILVVGFGFADPFLTRVVEQTLRNQESDNRHFAFIGYRGSEPMTTIGRRTFARKYRLTPIFYRVVVDPVTGAEDHSELTALLALLQEGGSAPPAASGPPAEADAPTALSTAADDAARREFERDLLVAPSGKQLYVEPRLYKPAAGADEDGEIPLDPVDMQEIVDSSRSVVISAPHEYGLTSLARRLAYEFGRTGRKVHVRDATQLPEYRAKLEKDSAFAPSGANPEGVLILDNFSFQDNERLLKEVLGLKRFARIVIMAKASDSATQIEDARIDGDFDTVLLSHIERSDIRTLASQMYGTSDVDLISGAVEKVYNDLLDLCIPLTPANVVMYLSVIFKEGDFIPLSRLQIIDRYVRELLRRPSDPYRDSFNVDNKLDVVSLFVHSLYRRGEVSFTQSDWNQFCRAYMKDALVSFDEAGLLSDLSASRVLGRAGSSYFFKYKLFYSFFLGRYVANRPAELKEFLSTNEHMKVESLVEVISGLSADNTGLIEDLCAKLEAALAAFQEQYALGEFDPYLNLEWKASTEEGKIWNKVSKDLAEGPADTAEVDKVKRSILAERRTEDQAVVIQNFSALEKSITHNQYELIAAINNAVDISGQLKTRAVKAILDAYLVAFQVGVLFSPIIASRKYFVWNGLGFVNRLDYSEEEAADPDRRIGVVLGALPRSMADRAAQEMGSKKLGQVYAHLAETDQLAGFRRLLNYALVLRSKPVDWVRTTERVIGKTDAKAMYLRFMLSIALGQFHEDVNTNAERGLLKRVVAMIQSKRELKKGNPSNKLVSSVVKRLDEISFFGKKVPSD